MIKRIKWILFCIAVLLYASVLFHFITLQTQIHWTEWRGNETMILIPGHAVYQFTKGPATNSSNWKMFNQHQFPYIKQHIQKGLELANNRTDTYLIMSGTATSPQWSISEAFSYYMLASHYQKDLKNYILEEFARDSFENLLFSICRFKQVTGHYPNKIHIIGFQFKENRFRNLHRQVLGIPESDFFYHHEKVTDEDQEWLKEAEKGELENAFKLFEQDPHGCSGKLLEKKSNRNPFRLQHGYLTSCPELKPFFCSS